MHSDLELPDQLKDFWFPVAFSSQLKEGAMVTMELFGEPWVMFRDAQGLAACVKDACAHRACPLSLVSACSCPLCLRPAICETDSQVSLKQCSCSNLPQKGLSTCLLPIARGSADAMVSILGHRCAGYP